MASISTLLSGLKKLKDDVASNFDVSKSGSMANSFWSGPAGNTLSNLQGGTLFSNAKIQEPASTADFARNTSLDLANQFVGKPVQFGNTAASNVGDLLRFNYGKATNTLPQQPDFKTQSQYGQSAWDQTKRGASILASTLGAKYPKPVAAQVGFGGVLNSLPQFEEAGRNISQLKFKDAAKAYMKVPEKVLQGGLESFPRALAVSGVVGPTQPIMDKITPIITSKIMQKFGESKIGQQVVQRSLDSILNILQGVPVNVALERTPADLQSIIIDGLTGAVLSTSANAALRGNKKQAVVEIEKAIQSSKPEAQTPKLPAGYDIPQAETSKPNWMDPILKKKGWISGDASKQEFDAALLSGDVAKVQELLPTVPEYYRKEMSSKINELVSQAGAINFGADIGTPPEVLDSIKRMESPLDMKTRFSNTDMVFQNIKTGEAKIVPEELKPLAAQMDSIGKSGDWHISSMEAGTAAQKMARGNWNVTGRADEAFLSGLSRGQDLQSRAASLEVNKLSDTGAYHAEATPKTAAKIAKMEEIAIRNESKARVEEAAKIVSKNVAETTNGAIRNEVKPADQAIANSSGWKDKPKLALGRETMVRNFEDVMGPDAAIMKKTYLDPISSSVAEKTRFLNKERADISKLGIKAGSEESKLLQMYGERKLSLEELKSSTPNWKQIVDAEGVFRQKYDQYLESINATLVKNGYDPIPKRKDYFLHFTEVGNLMESIGIPVKADLLPTDISGLTMDFKPGKNFFSSALQRKSDITDYDAIKGFDKYIEGAANQVYLTDNIQRLRVLENSLRDMHAGTTKLSNFVADLTDFTNSLAGKKSMVDRGVEGVFGRNIYGIANKMKSQVGANAVGGNVSSALTNYIPLTQSLATTDKPSFVKGMLETVMGVNKDDGFVNRSDFLTRRFGSDRLAVSNWDKVGQKAGWLFQTVDRFVSESIVRSKFLEGIKNGLDDTAAMKRADDWAARIMADRSQGQMPTLFNSKSLGALTQFQLEVNNQLSFMLKDIPRSYDTKGAASALAQVVLYSYIFNNIYENVAGRRPAMDPIGILQHAYENFTNEELSRAEAIKNTVNDIADNLPFSSIVTGGRLPVTSSLPNFPKVFSSLSKESGPDLMGAGKELAAPLLNLLPTGGGQLRKTAQGLSAYSKGYVGEDDAVKFPVKQDVPNLLRMGVFGQYATPEARQYFESGRSPLTETQSSLVTSGAKPYDQVLGGRVEAAGLNKLKSGGTAKNFVEVSDGVFQSGDSTFYSKQLDKTFRSQDAVTKAIAKDNFDKSGESFMEYKDVVLRRDVQGNVTTTPKVKYDYQLGNAKLTAFKNSGDLKSWLDTAQSQLSLIEQQLTDPSVDSLDKVSLENSYKSLSDNIKKYTSYNGFTKGKKISTKAPAKLAIKKSSNLKVTPLKLTPSAKSKVKTLTLKKLNLTAQKPTSKRITPEQIAQAFAKYGKVV